VTLREQEPPLRQRFPELGAQPDAESVFVRLRELRNSW